VNDAVNGPLEERQALDRGLSAGFLLSFVGHLLIAGVAFGAAALAPKEPLLKANVLGFAVPLPRGGGGTPNLEPPAPAPAAPEPPAPEPPKEVPPAPRIEPPKVIKPPKEVPKKGLPPVDARKSRRTPPTPPPRAATPERGTGATAGAVRDGVGRGVALPGLEFGPAGPGVPGGADGGDYYLAGVQRKIWTLWTQQIKTGFNRPVTVSFTILANGSVEDVRVVQTSGASLLDMAAQRSVMSAAPFHPLPKEYGTNRYTIQAIFRPTTP
jgi:protein TonB